MNKLDDLTTGQIEYIAGLIHRDMERRGHEAKILSRELGQESEPYQRAEAAFEKVSRLNYSVGQVLTKRQRIDETRRRSGVVLDD